MSGPRQWEDWGALADGRHGDPFAILGVHPAPDGGRLVRTLQPHAHRVTLLDRAGERVAPMVRVHPGGIFETGLPPRLRHYRLGVTFGDGARLEIEDPYRFPATLGDVDRYLLAEGSDKLIYRKLGAHRRRVLGIEGTRFAVWAPNAQRVSVVGDFNGWDGRCHPMRRHPGCGVWELFLPGIVEGALYKFELLDWSGQRLPLKTDPYGHYFEPPPGNASIVHVSSHDWEDDAWMARRSPEPRLGEPLSIYEVHLGSWRRSPDDPGQPLGYRDLARELVPYVVEMGFTHIELMPVTEHPFDGSWGYQPIGLFAPTRRMGQPDDFRHFVDRCHQAGIGVIMDWVPAHFPRDPHGLVRFDGSALYEHEDPRRGEHPDWGTLIFNFGRREVVNYLLGSALYWIEEFHIDALRVDAVASMLYLDYSREEGAWLPNVHGGNENLEAVDFLRHANTHLHAHGANSHAEESTAWPAVSRPVDNGGLGFTCKWNMGWMHDTLSYMREDPVHRRHHHDRMTFGLMYAFDENFILPLSHDEVVHGKGSLLGKMPGDEWQRFANLRAYYAFMHGHPGKKLLFMGGEFGQVDEWSHQRSLDWHLLQYPLHAGLQALVRDLNHLHRDTPALHQRDFDPGGFQWLDWNDRDNSVYAWLRRADGDDHVVCLVNFTPVARRGYRVGVPGAGAYHVCLDSDASTYGGSGQFGLGTLTAKAPGHHGQPHALDVDLPPLAALFLRPGPAPEQPH